MVTAVVDTERRDAIRRNHTATHLLHAALRKTLGTHVKQAGSLVAPDRLRFDFTHYAALDEQDLLDIEDLVNEHILANRRSNTKVMDLDAAVNSARWRCLARNTPTRCASSPSTTSQRSSAAARTSPHGRHRPVQDHL